MNSLQTSPYDGRHARQFVDWLKETERFIVYTHVRPDPDAWGAALGLAFLVKAMRGQFAARVYLDLEGIAPAYREFIGDCEAIIEDVPGDWPAVCVDCSVIERLALPADSAAERIIWQIDHHQTSALPAVSSLIVPSAAATCSILAELALRHGLPMEKEAATYFLCGLYGDTGGFRYPNTSPEDLHLAGSLLSAGAEHQRIIETLYFSRSMAFLKLQAYAIDHLTVIGEHELAYFVIREELLNELQADPSDADDLLDNIRVLREIPAYCKIQETGPDTVRFSLRSRDQRYPVLPVARELGGGGHLLAAGARMTGVSLEQAEAALLNAWRKVFHGD